MKFYLFILNFNQETTIFNFNNIIFFYKYVALYELYWLSESSDTNFM